VYHAAHAPAWQVGICLADTLQKSRAKPKAQDYNTSLPDFGHLAFGASSTLSCLPRLRESSMKLHPYLTFTGQCDAAMNFYHSIVGGVIEERHTYAGSPLADKVPANFGDKIMHMGLRFNGQLIMACDSAKPAVGFHGIAMVLHVETEEEAEKTFAQLSQNGEVTMPMAPTFWAKRFGMVTDQFGVKWTVNCDLPK
jgi:PhnB protein